MICDHILAGTSVDTDHTGLEFLRTAMQQGTIVSVTNVWECLLEQPRAYDFDLIQKTIPTLKLPWPVAVFEWRAQTGDPFGHWACVAEEKSYDDVKGMFSGRSTVACADTRLLSEPKELPEAHVFLVMGIYCRVKQFVASCGIAILGLDEDGRLINAHDGRPYVMTCTDGQFDQDREETMAGGLAMGAYVVANAISFLHCKNVVVEDKVFGAAQLKGRADTRQPYVLKYKTLRVTPMRVRKTATQSEAIPHEQGLTPLHICRGHFKDCRKNGLFGLHHGIYWWAQHARGSKEHGEVVKHYEIEAPMGAGGTAP